MQEQKSGNQDADYENKRMRSHHVHPFLTRDEIRHVMAVIKQAKKPAAQTSPVENIGDSAKKTRTASRIQRQREKQRDISFRARREEGFRFKFSSTVNPHVRQNKQYSKHFNQ